MGPWQEPQQESKAGSGSKKHQVKKCMWVLEIPRPVSSLGDVVGLFTESLQHCTSHNYDSSGCTLEYVCTCPEWSQGKTSPKQEIPCLRQYRKAKPPLLATSALTSSFSKINLQHPLLHATIFSQVRTHSSYEAAACFLRGVSDF